MWALEVPSKPFSRSRSESPSLRPFVLAGAVFNLTTHLLPALVGCDVSTARANQAQNRDTSHKSNDAQAVKLAEEEEPSELMDETTLPLRPGAGEYQVIQADIGSVVEEKSGGDGGGMKGDNADDALLAEHRDLSTAEVTNIFAVLDRNGDGQVEFCVSFVSLGRLHAYVCMYLHAHVDKISYMCICTCSQVCTLHMCTYVHTKYAHRPRHKRVRMCILDIQC